MNTQTSGALAADERGRVAALLARYPALTSDELADVTHWFKRAATPLDVGTLASDTTIAEQYRRYRAEHLDRFGTADMVKAAIFVAIALAVAAVIVMRMP
ncbi:hypothetical protein [Novosphingobium sp. 9]|uniref:hypothetical protein n=1 Tax=Novosphingobium sp. 9 TaxID=2025349 RepID=UPI0021B606F7|nr:hypothetical protein [Novosphingobium sp. 9]